MTYRRRHLVYQMSVYKSRMKERKKERSFSSAPCVNSNVVGRRTNVEQNCAVKLLVHNVIGQHLVIQGLWLVLRARHFQEGFG